MVNGALNLIMDLEPNFIKIGLILVINPNVGLKHNPYFELGLLPQQLYYHILTSNFQNVDFIQIDMELLI